MDTKPAPKPKEEEHGCDCACHDGGSHGYRLMQGSSIEGISIREVVTDKDGDIVGWSLPLAPPAASSKEMRHEVEETIKELVDMREAFGLPIIDEAQLESELEDEEEK